MLKKKLPRIYNLIMLFMVPIQIFIQDSEIRCKSTKYKGEKIHNREQNRFYIVISSTPAVFLVYKEIVSLSTNKLSVYETEIKMKNSMRKKLLVLGAFVSVVMLVSCTGSKEEIPPKRLQMQGKW